jgi:putative intracellular protease/amidase
MVVVLELAAVAALAIAAWFGAAASLRAGAAAGGAQPPETARREPERPPLTPHRQVAVLVFEGVQIIDFTGPYEVFGQAGYDTFTVAEKPGPITTSMGLTVMPRHTFADSPSPDVLVVPGGNVASAEDSAATLAWIGKAAGQAPIVLSVCNGAFILARAGLLDGLEATTFAGLIDELRTVAPRTRVVRDKRFVDNGRIITTAGLSSGLDGALHVVDRLDGRGAAQATATGMEYNWDPAGTYVRAALADRYLRPALAYLRTLPRHIVAYEGTTERWEARWRVEGDAPTAELLAGIETAMAAAGSRLRPEGSAGPGGAGPGGSAAGAGQGAAAGLGQGGAAGPEHVGTAGTRVWTFADDRGRAWQGVARVEAAPGAAHARLITLRVRLAA